ncbi:MAG: VapE domain-containing protein [Hyphomicrobiaceae bacterium]
MNVTPFPRPSKSDWPAANREGAIIHKAQENVAYFLEQVRCELFTDAFASRLMLSREGTTAPLDDAATLKLYFEADAMGLKPPKPWFIDCLTNLAHGDRRNAVLDEINSLVWDGTPRLDGWLVRHAHGRDTEYDRQAFMLCCIAMVRRIRHPGTKFDQIPVLEGSQGGGKSTFLRILARHDSLFTDALSIGAKDKETLEITTGKLIVELGELAGISKQDLNHVKAFASRQSDRARLPYARFAVEIPRNFTVWGTTNDHEYLSDPTGNRRFWPLKVGKFNIPQATADCDQLWAEAAALEANGHPITLPESLWTTAAETQAERLVSDTWQEIVAEKLDLFRDMPIKVRSHCAIKAIGIEPNRIDRKVDNRVAAIMRRLGFTDTRIGRTRARGWIKGGPGKVSTLLCDTLNGNFRITGERE